MQKWQVILGSLAVWVLLASCVASPSDPPLSDSSQDSGSSSDSASEDASSTDNDTGSTPDLSSNPSAATDAFSPRPEQQICRFDGLPPGSLPPLRVNDNGTFLPLDMPVRARLAPSSARQLWIASAKGQIHRFTPQRHTPTRHTTKTRPPSSTFINHFTEQLHAKRSDSIVLDIQSRVACCEDRGLLDFAIRPHEDREADDSTTELFVLYRGKSISQGFTRLSRFIVPLDGQANPNEERILFEVSLDLGSPQGGWTSFGADGMLYIAIGSGQEPDNAQDPSSRLGKLLRIDISTIEETGNYTIPPTNPFADAVNPIERETWALGLRDPWRCSFDSLDATLWCGDAGLERDEINQIQAGKNYGWPLAEGKDCRVSPAACEQLSLSSPTWVHLRQEQDCGITGGIVYRGSQEPLLNSAYLYSDRCSGRIYAWTRDANQQIRHHGELGRWSHGISSFATDSDHEPLLIGNQSPTLASLETIQDPSNFPTSLSQSSCYDNLTTLQTGPDLIPFELNAPLWSDGSTKFRHVMIPPQQFIEVLDDGSWIFPEGTLILKTFAFSNPQSKALRPIETRVMKRDEKGWKFFTYAWNEAGTDATYQEQSSDRPLMIDHDGQTIPLTYHIPSEFECRVCHGFGSSKSLGPSIQQLHRKIEIDGQRYDQLLEMEKVGLFSKPLSPEILSAPPMPAFDDLDQPLENRARAYLHGNCGHCHRPGGWVPPLLDLDLRAYTPFANTRSCRVEPQYDLWTNADFRIDPGDSENSAVWMRMNQQGFGRMPPLATQLIDPQSIVVKDWIESLADCPPSP